ncbi:unnamed protein product, partial [Amoebophrya sp. A25]
GGTSGAPLLRDDQQIRKSGAVQDDQQIGGGKAEDIDVMVPRPLSTGWQQEFLRCTSSSSSCSSRSSSRTNSKNHDSPHTPTIKKHVVTPASRVGTRFSRRYISLPKWPLQLSLAGSRNRRKARTRVRPTILQDNQPADAPAAAEAEQMNRKNDHNMHEEEIKNDNTQEGQVSAHYLTMNAYGNRHNVASRRDTLQEDAKYAVRMMNLKNVTKNHQEEDDTSSGGEATMTMEKTSEAQHEQDHEESSCQGIFPLSVLLANIVYLPGGGKSPDACTFDVCQELYQDVEKREHAQEHAVTPTSSSTSTTSSCCTTSGGRAVLHRKNVDRKKYYLLNALAIGHLAATCSEASETLT